MSIAINPVFPVIGAQQVAPDVVLQPGTVIDATVLKVLSANLVRIAIANLSIQVLSEVPLQAGQVLQLAVSQTPQGVQLAIVPQGDGEATQPAPAPSPGAPALATSPGNASATQIAPNIAAAKVAPASDMHAPPPLTNIEALAVSAAVQTAAAKQASLSPLFANLAVAAASSNLPPVIQQAAAVLLALRPDLNGNISGENIKAAFEKSGLFLEQSQSTRAASVTPAAANQQPDLKAALIVFRQTVASWLDAAPAPSSLPAASAQQPTGPAASTASAASQQEVLASVSQQQATPQPAAGQAVPQTLSPPIVPLPSPGAEADEIMLPQAALPVAHDMDADPKMQIFSPDEPLPTMSARAAATHAGLASMQEILQAFPKGVRDAVHAMLDNEGNIASSPNTNGAKAANVNSGSTDAPPPFRGAAPSAQPIASPSLAQDAEPVAVARHLVSDADAAIARQTLLQVASLPDRVDMQGLRQDANIPRWNFEIPFATTQGTAVAQFEISRDGGNGAAAQAAQRVWKARFSLNVEPNGPVHALVSLSGARASVRMWAERSSTVAQLRANAPQLTHALREAALEPGDIVIDEGAPPQPASPPAGHFLDRAL